MHWFLRAAISVVISFVLLAIINLLMARTLTIRSLSRWDVLIAMRFVGLSLPIALYAALTRLSPRPTAPDRETRCRQCSYILRGITEPRCPECGERI
jgi:hypothetical protein